MSSRDTSSPHGARSHIAFPALPRAWSYKRFGDILDVQGGSQPPKSTFLYEPRQGYIQLLQIRDFGEQPVPTYVKEESVTKRCAMEDILIARYGASLGRLLTGKAGAYNVALAKVIHDKEKFNTRYLFYLLQTPFFQTPIHMISRSAQNGFNKGDLADILLPIAPVDEQYQIVSRIDTQFTRLDAAIKSLRAIKSKLASYRRAILKAAFNGELINTDIKKWNKMKLKDIADVVMGQSPPGNTYNVSGEGVPLINGPVEFGPAPLSETIKAKFTSKPTKFCEKDDLILCVRGSTTGRTNVAGFKACIGRGVAAIRAKCDQMYLNYFILSIRREIFDMGTGSTFPNISLNQIKNIYVPVASPEEQPLIVSEIESRFSVIDKVEEVVDSTLPKSERLRKSILKSAFEGKLT